MPTDPAHPSHNAEPVHPGGPRTSPVLVALAWLFVGVPLAWGVEQTAAKSMDLFRAPAAQPAATTQPATTSPAPATQPT
jgi:hypothetical protein